MNKTPWRTELFRLIITILCCVALQQIIGNWTLSIAISAVSLIGFIGFKLHELSHWLNNDMADEFTPESSGIIGFIVTQMYRRKKSIEHSQEQQQTTLRQFNEIISAIPSATVVINKDHEIEWANYPALLLLGINGQRDAGIKIDSLLREIHFSKKLLNGNGEEFEMASPVDANVTLAVQMAKYAQGKRLLLAHNITPHIEVQHSRKTFIANASHELRTPLTVIAGYLEFIHSTPNLPEELQIPVEKALEQSANMQALIDDLLVISRLQNRTLDPESVSQINLKQHLDSLLQTLDAGGKIRQHKVIANVGEKLVIHAARKELDSVCYNLINNALKYSEDNSDIIIRWEKIDNSQLKFSVTDFGIGIAPEHIARLTERFYRVDKGRSRRVGGTGLGLCIVKYIVERHHGQLEIHSRLGEGSTFAVILPINPLEISNHQS